MDKTELVKQYLDSLSDHQLFVMDIAKERLGSSFNVSKSNGFIKWLAKQEK